MGYFFLIIALTLNAAANILMKLGSGQLNLVKGESLLVMAPKLLTNYFLMFGIFLFALNIVFYIIALSKIDLFIAYPIMTAGGFLLITLFSFFYLKESITLPQLMGIILVAIGITLIAYHKP
jgi:multidrug transporter EmrE-like cation transporter